MSKIKTGEVTIQTETGPLILTVRELSMAGEVDLIQMLRSRAKEALGPQSFYKMIKPILDDKTVDDGFKLELRRTACDKISGGAGLHDDAVLAFRCSPPGVALEIFLRSRDTHPEVTEKDLAVAINLANCTSVRMNMIESLNKEEDSGN